MLKHALLVIHAQGRWTSRIPVLDSDFVEVVGLGAFAFRYSRYARMSVGLL